MVRTTRAVHGTGGIGRSCTAGVRGRVVTSASGPVGPNDSLRPLRTSLPRRLDFAEIRRSPRINDAPLDSAVLAVCVDPQPYLVGDPAVVGADGQWRLVERGLLNMRNPNSFEQQFELSPDGTILALGDEFGVVFLHLAAGTTTRAPTRLKDPVLHSWTGQSRGVLVTERGGPGVERAWGVRVAGTNLPCAVRSMAARCRHRRQDR